MFDDFSIVRPRFATVLLSASVYRILKSVRTEATAGPLLQSAEGRPETRSSCMAAVNGEGPTWAAGEATQIVFESLARLNPQEEVIYKVQAQGRQLGNQIVRVQVSCDDGRRRSPVRKALACSRIGKGIRLTRSRIAATCQ
jgi:hypothetical protein